MLSVLSHLALVYFGSQAVEAVENEVPVQLVVGAVDEAPDCFSLCLKTLPGAQRGLRTKKKLHYDKSLKNIVNPPPPKEHSPDRLTPQSMSGHSSDGGR